MLHSIPSRRVTRAVAGGALALALTVPSLMQTAAAAQPTAQPTAAQAVPRHRVGQTVRFRHLSVTVRATDRKSDSYFFGAKIKVCVTSLPRGTSSLRLSWDPWTITASGRMEQPGNFEAGGDPWHGHDARLSGRYRLGQCMSGWLPFAVAGTANVTRIGYHNSLGNRATWTVRNGQSPQRSLGSAVKFRHFTVKVTETEQTARGFRAWVKTCVRSLPPGSRHGRTRLSWDPWWASAGTHFAFAPNSVDVSHTWGHLYPRTGMYRVGQCASGWLPFEDVIPELHIDRLAYRNSLGNQAFWTVPR